jgi:PAS domain S-box-containing protein
MAVSFLPTHASCIFGQNADGPSLPPSEFPADQTDVSTTDERPDALLSGLFDASPDGIVAFDRELRYTAWSPAMERMTGMPAADVVGRVMYELFPFLEAIGERAGAEAALRGESALAPERPFRVAATGQEGWAETHYAPLRDADGRVVGGVATVRDVTGRVRAGEAAAGWSAEDVLESMGDDFAVLDRQWRYAYVNRAAEATVRRPRGELLGGVVWELFPELVGTGAERELRRAMDGGVPVAYEVEMRSLDRRLEVRAFPFAEGLAVYSRDVTEARRAEAELRAGESRFRALVEAGGRTVWSTDAAGMVGDMPDWRALTGQTPEEVRGEGWQEAIHPDDRAGVAEAWRSARRARGVYEAEYRVRLRGGEFRWFAARGAPVLGPDGEVREWVGTLHDVHDRREAEAGREAERDLLQRVLAQLPAAVAVYEGPQHVFAAYSDRYHRVVGRREVMGRPFGMVLPELVKQGFAALLDQVYATGEPISGTAVRADWDDDGDGRMETHLVDYVYQPLRDGAGRVAGVVAHVTDVGERERASRERDEARREAEARAEEAAALAMQLQEQAAELELQVEESQALAEELQAANQELADANVQAEVLARVSTLLAESLDPRASLEAVGRLVVPALADLCVVYAVEPDGRVARVQMAHSDPGKERTLREIDRRWPRDPAPHVLRILETGEPLLVEDARGMAPAGAAHDDEYVALQRALQPRSGITVPMIARGRRLGVISLGSDRRAFGPEDLAVAEELARRAAVAVDNAALYREARASLAEAERRAAELRATLEAIPDAVMIGTRGGLTLANEAALALFGLGSVGELNAAQAGLQEHVRSRDAATGEPIALEEQPFARALAGERSVREVVGRHPVTGEERVIRIAAAPILVDGSGAGAVAVGSDVTEQRRAQEAQRILAEASRALASSLEYEATVAAVARMAVPALADWCFVEMREPDGSVRMVAAAHRDPALVEMALETSRRWPIDPDAPYGTGHVLRTGEPELVPVIPEEVLDAVAKDAEHAALLRRMRFRSSLSVPIAVRGRTEGVLSLVSSDSGRLYGEDDLALALEVARRAAVAIDNARLYEEARAANAAKAGFLATMSHELRTPLNAMLGYVELLLLGIPEPVPAGATRHVERIRLAAQHLLSIIEEILTFSRIEAGRERVEPEEVDLLGLVGEVSAIIEPLAAGKGLAFRVPERVEPPSLVTDPRKLRQILVNLLGNAVKFTRAGSVAFEVEPDGGHLQLRVRDTGIGIAPADLEVIFEPFRQVDSTMTRPAGGTGLGLSVSRQLARLLGGDVTVESRPGEGSVFTVSLPLA